MIREGRTTVHDTGQRHNTGHRRRETTPKVLCKRPREQQGREEEGKKERKKDSPP